MPPLNGFIGEITILQGAYQMSFNWAFWGAVGIALGAAYLLWLFQRTMLGEVIGQEREAAGSFVAGDRGIRAAGGVGVLDRPEPAAVLPGAGAAGGADRGAGAPRLLCAAPAAESARAPGRRAHRISAVVQGASSRFSIREQFERRDAGRSAAVPSVDAKLQARVAPGQDAAAATSPESDETMAQLALVIRPATRARAFLPGAARLGVSVSRRSACGGGSSWAA